MCQMLAGLMNHDRPPPQRSQPCCLPRGGMRPPCVRGVSGAPLPHPSPEKEKKRSDHESVAMSEQCRSGKCTINPLNSPSLVMEWGSCKSKKMSREYGPRGILLLLALGPTMSAVITSAPAASAAFGRSMGNWFCTGKCRVHPSALKQMQE